LIRVDSAKVNITPPMAEAKWFRLVGVNIGNESELYPHGDQVQTVEVWTAPDTFADLSNVTINAILTIIDTGLPDGTLYSDARRLAGDRAQLPGEARGGVPPDHQALGKIRAAGARDLSSQGSPQGRHRPARRCREEAVMNCAFRKISNAHQTRKRSARLLFGALREKVNAQGALLPFPLKAHQTRKRRARGLEQRNRPGFDTSTIVGIIIMSGAARSC